MNSAPAQPETTPSEARPAPPKWRAAGVLAALLLLAALLRGWGLGWGLPHPGRYYPYHPDEAVLLFVVGQVNPLWGDFAPGFYNYGTLYIFLCRLAYDFTAPFLGWGAVPQAGPFPQWVNDFAHLLLVSRVVTVALGVATVGLTVRLGSLLYGGRTGWLAGGFLAAAPLAVVLSHYMTVDVPSAFFTTLTLLCAAQALRAETGKAAAKWIVFGACATGLAAGTKYNTAPVLLSLLVPLWHHFRPGGAPRKAVLLALPLAALAVPAGFLLATPGALLETEQFVKNVAYEMGRNREGQGLIFQHTPPALLYHLGVTFPIALEWPLYLLSLAGIGWAVWKRREADLLLLLFFVPFFVLLLPAERKFLRYITPLIPVAVLLAARLVDEGLGSRVPGVWKGLGALAAAAALASSVAHAGVFAAPDSRDLAAAHLKSASRPDDLVALASDAWYYTPPVHPTAGCVKIWALPFGGPPIWDTSESDPRPDVYPLESFRILAPQSHPVPTGALPVTKLTQYRPNRVVLTDYEYEDPVRIKKADPNFNSGVLELMAVLDRDYRLEQEFRPRPRLAGFTWWRSGIPPHDWRYPMPTVRVYARKDQE